MMGKAKTKAHAPDVASILEGLPKEDWEALREVAALDAAADEAERELLAFDEMITDYSERGALLVCKLAKIPEHHKKDFLREAEDLI
jgi:hypothetical protein